MKLFQCVLKLTQSFLCVLLSTEAAYLNFCETSCCHSSGCSDFSSSFSSGCSDFRKDEGTFML